MRHWLATSAGIAIWATLSLVYCLGAFAAVGVAFGREGDTPHLAGLLAAFILLGGSNPLGSETMERTPRPGPEPSLRVTGL